MQPVLNPETQSSSDYVFLSKWAVRNFEVERGDIVALGTWYLSFKTVDNKFNFL